MNKLITFTLSFPLLLMSCQSVTHRQPSSTEQIPSNLTGAMEDLYKTKLQVKLIKEQLATEDRRRGGKEKITSNPDQNIPVLDDKKYQALTQQLDSLIKKQNSDSGILTSKLAPIQNNEPISVQVKNTDSWSLRTQEFHLDNISDFTLKQGRPSRIFNFDRVGNKNYEARLKSFLISLDDPYQNKKDSYLQASLTCDGPFIIKQSFSNKSYQANQTAKFRLYDSKYNGDNLRLVPSSGVKNCELKAGENITKPQYGARFVEPVDPYADLNSLVDVCLLPRTDALTGIEKFFLSDKFDSMTCPQQVPAIINLPEAEDSLKSKAEVLLGQPLPSGFMDKRDPQAPLDFSKAPYFDSIYVSYLVFRADYYGTFISRLLEFHANRGTKIKILIAGVITLDKDEKMLHGLIARNPNIQLQELKYIVPEAGSLGDLFDHLHRSMHVKLFLTLSKTRPENNVAFIGGRNIHDGFIFKNPYDYPNPDMVNYAKGDEGFVHWRDFEFKIHSKSFAEKAAAHFLTIWNRDAKTMVFRDINLNLPLKTQVNTSYFNGQKPLIRHYVSVPFKDNQRLIDLYVEMLDSAKKKILISTPYFRPPQPIFDALERATQRGVEVTVITRLDLKGDTVDWLLSESNKPTVNKLFQKVKIYEYTEPKVILHSKIVLIDDVFSFLGSVNWNKRSFIHDMENGTMIYGAAYNQEMTALYNQYKSDSRIIDERLKRSFIKGLILKVFDEEF